MEENMSESNENANVESTESQAVEAQASETKKVEAKAAPAPKPSRTAPPLPEGTHYIWGTGRRKASIARVRIKPGSGKILINQREVVDYFKKLRDQETALAPLNTLGMLGSFDVFANVSGGGSTGQAGAVSLGVARALSKHMPDNEHDLRNKGLLTRDARMKERKKPGQPGARKSFQFSKR